MSNEIYEIHILKVQPVATFMSLELPFVNYFLDKTIFEMFQRMIGVPQPHSISLI